MRLFLILLLLNLFFLISPQFISAEDTKKADKPSELELAFVAAEKTVVFGPKKIPMISQAEFSLPEGYGFIPKAEAAKLMLALGNSVSDGLIGLIIPNEGLEWFVEIEYRPSGYIKDDDAKKWDVDGMLQTLKDGTEEGNKYRLSKGIPAMEVIGWVERPHYDEKAHQLIWSVSLKDKGAQTKGDEGINYNTYALGREGYFSMNMIANLSSIESLKPTAKIFLNSLNYNNGKKYSDFNSTTDKVAEYGLMALIGGVAAKKLGLIAIIGAFLLKFAKLIVIGFIAIGGLISKKFLSKKSA